MRAVFKWLVIVFLVAVGIKGDVMITSSTVDIHLHDTYYVIDLTHFLLLFAL